MKLGLPLLLCLLGLVGCSPPNADSNPSWTVRATDLIGSWTLNYSGKVVSSNPDGKGYGVEELTFKEDGSYEQRFDDQRGGSLPVNQGTWQIVKDSEGQQKVILTNMRFFPEGASEAVHSAGDGTTPLLIQYSTNVPFIGKKELILCFDKPDLNFCFSRSKGIK